MHNETGRLCLKLFEECAIIDPDDVEMTTFASDTLCDEWRVPSTVTVKTDKKKGEIVFLMDGKPLGKPLPLSRKMDWFPGVALSTDGIHKFQIL